MKTALVIVGLMLVFSTVAIADTGGPDAYGYRWTDNDSAGGPTYNWADISSCGVLVSGLSDDNNVGPFSFGFEFPYYWYTINHCWIGSNGYIEFYINYNYAHPFSNIPNAASPNDYMAVLAGDLDFTRGNPSCYYYTNNVDSFVVSWINVGEYGYIDSLHTFQVILCTSDSSITYQYGPNHGRFLDSGGGNEDVIGIEDISGTNGLQYLRENLPSRHMWHEGLAIKFHPNPDPEFQIHDFSVLNGFNNSSGAIFVPRDSAFTPRARFKNIGNQPESNLQVRCQIRRGSTTVYNITDTLDYLDPTQQVWVDFSPQYTPNQTGVYKATFTAILTGDQNSSNNSKICEIDVYILPSELGYCDDSAESGRSWTGDDNGFGVEFAIPDGIAVSRADFYIDQVYANGPAYVWFLLDDGTGHPDENNPIAGDTIVVTHTGWIDVEFPTPNNLIFSANEKFYMVVLSAIGNNFSFGMDQTAPQSNRGWEYTDGLAPDRDRGLDDIMFKIYADTSSTSFCFSIIGDINDDQEANALDISAAVNYFHGLVQPPDSCLCGINGRVYVSGDVNGSCGFDGIDVTYFVNYIKGGPGLQSCSSCQFRP